MKKWLVCSLAFFLSFSSGFLNGEERKVPAGYRLVVDPGKVETHPGEEVIIAAVVEQQYETDAVEYKEHKGEYVGVPDMRVVIKKVTGLIDGSITPSENKDTDMLGVAHFTYKAGQNDKLVTITFEHTFYIRYPRPARTFTGNAVITVVPYNWEGTISMSDSMKADEGESLLAALTPGGEYDIAKNWCIHVSFKPSASYATNGAYTVDKVELQRFEDRLDQTMFKMEREGRRIEGKSKETAKTKGRPLSATECNLMLRIIPESGTYWLMGNITVKGIPQKGKDEMDIKVAPVNKKIDENGEGTTEIDENIDVSGTFTPSSGQVPAELKGSKDYLEDVPEEFGKIIEAIGGKQTMVLKWDLKRK